MPLPGFLGPHTILPSAPQIFALPLGGAGSTSGKLNFAIQSQQQTNWCWAAVSTSVSQFYDAGSTWNQCLVANQVLSRQDCCHGGAADPMKCNKPWYLDDALQATGNFIQMLSQRLSFSEIQAQIGQNAPVGCRVGWHGGGGHFMVISGWVVGDSGTEYIDISDPIYLYTQVAYDDFADSYQSGGDWTHSYLTGGPAGGGAILTAGLAQRTTATADRASIGA